MTILPWRQRLMTFVELIPVKVLAITRKGEEIKQSIDLDGKTIVVERNTTYESNFKDLEIYHNLDIEYMYMESGQETSEAVSNGSADVTAKDSNKAITEVQLYPKPERKFSHGRTTIFRVGS